MIIVLLPGTVRPVRQRPHGRDAPRSAPPRRRADRLRKRHRDRYDVGLDGDVVKIDGTLWDRWGPAVSFGDDALRFHARVLVDCGVLPDSYDGTWTRNYD